MAAAENPKASRRDVVGGEGIHAAGTTATGCLLHCTFLIGIAALYVLLASVGVVIIRSSRQHASPAIPTPAPPSTAQPEVTVPGTQNPPLTYCPDAQQLRIVPTHGRQFT